ncbi:MAG TPA: FixH family protein [Methylomirabilota bacterium]|nr:FixH family protein [Methylomirabilota bacterium]
MDRMFASALAGLLLLAGTAWSAEKVIHTQKAKDMEITLKSESGQWKPGKNNFVLEFAKTKQPVDAGKVSLSTSMAMSGMAPMIAGATLTPDKTPGRYLGTIEFPDSGTRQVTVMWEGAAGNGSMKFSVPVR